MHRQNPEYIYSNPFRFPFSATIIFYSGTNCLPACSAYVKMDYFSDLNVLNTVSAERPTILTHTLRALFAKPFSVIKICIKLACSAKLLLSVGNDNTQQLNRHFRGCNKLPNEAFFKQYHPPKQILQFLFIPQLCPSYATDISTINTTVQQKKVTQVQWHVNVYRQSFNIQG